MWAGEGHGEGRGARLRGSLHLRPQEEAGVEGSSAAPGGDCWKDVLHYANTVWAGGKASFREEGKFEATGRWPFWSPATWQMKTKAQEKRGEVDTEGGEQDQELSGTPETTVCGQVTG